MPNNVHAKWRVGKALPRTSRSVGEGYMRLRPREALVGSEGRFRRTIVCRAYCSREHIPFLVIAQSDGIYLRWISGSAVAGRPCTPDLQTFPAQGFTCPIFGNANQVTPIWQCVKCKKLHCMGKTGEPHVGYCGQCIFDGQSVASAPLPEE